MTNYEDFMIRNNILDNVTSGNIKKPVKKSLPCFFFFFAKILILQPSLYLLFEILLHEYFYSVLFCFKKIFL